MAFFGCCLLRLTRSAVGTNFVTSFVKSLSFGSADIVASPLSFTTASPVRRTTGSADITELIPDGRMNGTGIPVVKRKVMVLLTDTSQLLYHVRRSKHFLNSSFKNTFRFVFCFF